MSAVERVASIIEELTASGSLSSTLSLPPDLYDSLMQEIKRDLAYSDIKEHGVKETYFLGIKITRQQDGPML